MLCEELLSKSTSPVPRVKLEQDVHLHPHGRRLIQGWFDRGWRMRDQDGEECFEAFIYTWIAVNSWASCVTGRDTESVYLNALIQDSRLGRKFDELLSDQSSPLTINVREFGQLWPIFRVQQLRRQNLRIWDNSRRDERINYYLANGADNFEPRCWKRHRDAEEDVPIDWPHTLRAIYRVRCNLFHGEKAPHSEMDQRIVSHAFRTLVYFFRHGDYL